VSLWGANGSLSQKGTFLRLYLWSPTYPSGAPERKSGISIKEFLHYYA